MKRLWLGVPLVLLAIRAEAVVTATWTVETYQQFDAGDATNAFITSTGELRPGWDTKRTKLEGDAVFFHAPGGADEQGPVGRGITRVPSALTDEDVDDMIQVNVTALTGEAPLTPLASAQLFAPQAGSDPRSRQVSQSCGRHTAAVAAAFALLACVVAFLALVGRRVPRQRRALRPLQQAPPGDRPRGSRGD